MQRSCLYNRTSISLRCTAYCNGFSALVSSHQSAPAKESCSMNIGALVNIITIWSAKDAVSTSRFPIVT